MSVFCPACNTDHDFDRDASITPVWCSQHAPSIAGEDDAKVTLPPVGLLEGGTGGREACDAIHRPTHD